MFKKVILSLFLFIFSQSNCIAEFVKQADEYTCAPTCTFNLIKTICPECQTSIQDLAVLMKTDKNGTTTFNLCKGLEEYFHIQNKKINIEYYGHKNVKKYKKNSNINLIYLKKHIENNGQAIINIGIYIKNIDNSFIRQWGHYVNVIEIENNSIKVSDPYDKQNKISTWTNIELTKINKIKNINDNEKYKTINNFYLIKNGINYLNIDEFAMINGIIFLK